MYVCRSTKMQMEETYPMPEWKDVECSDEKWETHCLEKWYGITLRRMEGKQLVADYTYFQVV